MEKTDIGHLSKCEFTPAHQPLTYQPLSLRELRNSATVPRYLPQKQRVIRFHAYRVKMQNTSFPGCWTKSYIHIRIIDTTVLLAQYTLNPRPGNLWYKIIDTTILLARLVLEP